MKTNLWVLALVLVGALAAGLAVNLAAADEARVVEVTDAGDRGLGTLRWACEQVTGPRHVVVRVTEPIRLESRVRVGSNVHLDGRGAVLDKYGLIITGDSHVVIENLRIDQRYPISQGHGDGVLVWGREDRRGRPAPVRHVTLRHLSLSGYSDEAIDLNGDVDEITVQRCLIGPGLDPQHNFAVLIDALPSCANIVLKENVFAGGGARNPDVEQGTCHVVNNVITYGFYGPEVRRAGRMNLVGNFLQPAPRGKQWRRPVVMAGVAGQGLYLKDNIGHFKTADPWTQVMNAVGARVADTPMPPRSWRAAQAFAGLPEVRPAASAMPEVIKSAGCLPRSERDKRILREAGLGSWLAN